MLTITNLRVRSFDVDYLDLYWEAGSGDPMDYQFQVLRSETDVGPFEPVTGLFTDRYHFRDNTAQSLSRFRPLYYRIRVTSKVDPSLSAEYPSTGGASLSARPDLAALEIARQLRLVNQEYRGRSVIVLPRRTFGQRCTACTDPISQSRIRSGCVTCFDTGFVGGYHSPVRTSMYIEALQKPTMMKTDSASFVVEAVRGTMSNYPEVREGYLVIEAENRRWRVENPVDTAELLRATYAQYLTLTLLMPSDVAYRYPLPPQDFEPSPYRQFTLPSDPMYAEAP